MGVGESTIYLVGTDPVLSSSIQALLEINRFTVAVIDQIEPFLRLTPLKETDVILLELDRTNPAAFKVFNQLANRSAGPRLVITADQAFNFRPSDVFSDKNYEVLLHPIPPGVLMDAIRRKEKPNVFQ